ncbi:hypothetical protein BH23ACT5_BH23ACT5_20140 [soil metagenome]
MELLGPIAPSTSTASNFWTRKLGAYSASLAPLAGAASKE